MKATMKRWQLPSFGIKNLELVDVPVPSPGPRELLVRVSAVSLNYRDKLTAEGQLMPVLPSMPFTPASDVAGVVVGVGEHVTRFGMGQRVIGNFWSSWVDGAPPRPVTDLAQSLGGALPGVLAEYVVLHEDTVVETPASLSDAEASTLPVAGLTAWFALVEQGRLRPGETVVANGTGGVALFALQFAKALGAKTIATSGSLEKLARARALGATEVIHTGEHANWAVRVLELTAGRGADHILELLGGGNLKRSLHALASGGRVTQIGFMQDDKVELPITPLMLKNATVQGVVVGHRRAFEEMNRAIDKHGIRPVIDCSYAFDAVPAAFEHLERGAFGKVVVTLSQD